MKYWIWDGYFPGTGYAFAEKQEGLSPAVQLEILLGRPLEAPLPEVRVTALSRGRFPDVMASASAGLLVSSALQKVLAEHVAEGIQYLPARVKGKRGVAFWVVNPTARVAAMDRAKSKFQIAPGTDSIHRVRRLVLRRVPAGTPSIFHLDEIPQLILVSDTLRKALERASDSAGTFESPDTWRLGFFEDDEA